MTGEPQGDAKLTEGEMAALLSLAQAWNHFMGLIPYNADDVCEFRHGIHRLQDKILARPAIRSHPELRMDRKKP